MRKAQGRRFSARDASGKLLQRSFINVKDGREWQAKIRREKDLIRGGLEAPATLQPMSVEEYAKKFILRRERGEVVGKIRGRKRKPAVKGTWVAEAQRLRDYILPEVGGRLLGSITTDEWEALFDKIQRRPAREQWRNKKKQLSESTINKIRALLNRLYEDAIIDRVVTRNPIRDTAARDEGDPAAKSSFWSVAECVQFLTAAEQEDPQFFCATVWLLNTGARINELLALQFKDVHFSEGFVEIKKTVDLIDFLQVRDRTKGKRERLVGINRAMRDAYLKLCESVENLEPSSFVFGRGSQVPSYFAFRDLYKDVCARAKVRTIRIHDLRHTYGSQFMMAGGSLEELKEVLGHASLETTQRYAKFSKEHIKRAANTFEVGAPAEGIGKEPENK